MNHLFNFAIGGYVGFLVGKLGYTINQVEFWGYFCPFILLFILKEIWYVSNN